MEAARHLEGIENGGNAGAIDGEERQRQLHEANIAEARKKIEVSTRALAGLAFSDQLQLDIEQAAA